MSSSTSTSRKETERTKLIQTKCQTLLTQMLRDEDNKYCVDCDAKGPRWASWNLGVFLCIRCAGIHRNLGVHISRVKSVNLDTWTPEQVISLQQMGNSRARAVYEAQLPDGFRRPQTDSSLESFIRAKYEHKKYLAREWVPPSPPKVDWGKEIDEELEKQKRKKKTAQANSALGIGILGSGASDKKTSTTSAAKSTALPAPLPKPKPGQSGSSPKTQRVSTSSAGGDAKQCNDLLGLSSPTKPQQSVVGAAAQDLHNDSFSNFLSATPDSVAHANGNSKTQAVLSNAENSLAKQEEDFFNQGSLSSGIGEKDKSGKLTKDSILALYGNAPTNPTHNPHNAQISFGHVPPQQSLFSGAGGFTGMAPGGAYMAGGAPHPQQTQFMTPPNSASMYNPPVMTAPVSFNAPSLGMHMTGTAAGVGFGAQFPMHAGMSAATTPYTHQHMPAGMVGIMQAGSVANSASRMSSTQQQTGNINLMHTNQSLLGGMAMNGAVAGVGMPPMVAQQALGGMAGMQLGGNGISGGQHTASLNQQFGNLNIGNVWQ